MNTERININCWCRHGHVLSYFSFVLYTVILCILFVYMYSFNFSHNNVILKENFISIDTSAKKWTCRLHNECRMVFIYIYICVWHFQVNMNQKQEFILNLAIYFHLELVKCSGLKLIMPYHAANTISAGIPL